MDDYYLSNLVAKNLSPQESIHPRLLSRFEQSPEVVEVPSFPEADQVGEHQPIVPPPFFPAAPPQVQDRPAQETPSVPSTARMPPSPVQEPPRQSYRGRLTPPSNTPRLSEPQPVRKDEQLSTHLVDSPVFLQQPSQPDTSSRPDTRQGMLLPHNKEPESPPLAAAQYVREVVAERTVERTLTPALDPEIESPQRTALPKTSLDSLEAQVVHPPPDSPIIQPAPPESSTSPDKPAEAIDLRPVVPPLPELAVLKGTADPTPTVQVTIGRIEVRAAPSPSPTPKVQPTRAQVMSLDEYLRQRSNGSHR